MSSIVLRIKQFLDYQNIKTNAFEKEIGFSNGALASQIRNNKSIGTDKLEKILFCYPQINSEWLITGQGEMLKGFIEGPKIEILKSSPNTSVVELGEVAGLYSHFYVIVSPFIDKKSFKKYIKKHTDYYFIDELPRHAVSLDIDEIESHGFGPYRSFEVVDGEITGNVNDSISNGSIVTGLKVDHNINALKLNTMIFKHLILILKSGVYINALITTSLRESLALSPTINEDGSEQYGQFNMSDFIEVYAVVAVTKAM